MREGHRGRRRLPKNMPARMRRSSLVARGWPSAMLGSFLSALRVVADNPDPSLGDAPRGWDRPAGCFAALGRGSGLAEVVLWRSKGRWSTCWSPAAWTSWFHITHKPSSTIHLRERLSVHSKPVELGELLAGEGRTEVPVALADHLEDLALEVVVEAPVAPTAALAGHETLGAMLAVGPAQPLDLPLTQAQVGRSLGLRQPSLERPSYDFEAFKLVVAHRQGGARHSGRCMHDPTSLSCANPTHFHFVPSGRRR